MDQYRLMNQINQIFARQQTPGQYMGNPMPTFSRYDFGASSPSDAYAQGLPRRMAPMQSMQPPPPPPLPPPPEVSPEPSDSTGPFGDIQGSMRSAAKAVALPMAAAAVGIPLPPDMGAGQGLLAGGAPSIPGMGGGQGLQPSGGLLDTPGSSAGGFDLKNMGSKMQAFGRGQGGQGGGQGESMYAPLPSVMSAGPAGGRAGADVNLAALLRGNRRF